MQHIDTDVQITCDELVPTRLMIRSLDSSEHSTPSLKISQLPQRLRPSGGKVRRKRVIGLAN